MPPVPLPTDALEFIRQPRLAVIATLRPDGSPHTVATWYDWEDSQVLVSMDASRLRLRFIRADPRVALTTLDDESGSHISLLGRVVRLEQDTELKDIDRLAMRYTGAPFRKRDAARYSAWIEVDAWHGWQGSQAWPER